MKFVRPKDLEAGQIIVQSIYNKRGGCLLTANHELTRNMITQLINMDYAGVYVYDEYSEYDELNQICSEEERVKAINSLKNMDIDQVLFFCNSLVENLLDQEDICLDFTDLKSYHKSTYEHSINVAMLSIACGIGLGLNNKQLNDLAVGAMLHDIGKRSISKAILDKPAALTDEERAIINTHPQRGYDMLFDNELVTPNSRACVLLHHENYDGSGYPKQLAGEKINLLARIIHVADVYDALCQKRSYKEEFNPAEAIEYIMANSSSMFDPEVVTTFLRYVVVYPVGTDVMLSDGREARVVKNRSEFVLRPVVVVKDTKEKLDLAKDMSTYNITIVDSQKFYDGNTI